MRITGSRRVQLYLRTKDFLPSDLGLVWGCVMCGGCSWGPQGRGCSMVCLGTLSVGVTAGWFTQGWVPVSVPNGRHLPPLFSPPYVFPVPSAMHSTIGSCPAAIMQFSDYGSLGCSSLVLSLEWNQNQKCSRGRACGTNCHHSAPAEGGPVPRPSLSRLPAVTPTEPMCLVSCPQQPASFSILG